MKKYAECWFIWLTPLLLIASFYVSYLSFVAFVPLFFALNRCPIRASVVAFFPFALFLFWGVFQALYVYYGLNFFFSLFALLFLVMYYTLYCVVPFVLTKYLDLGVLGVSFVFVAFEYLRNVLLGGLPIGNINNLVYDISFVVSGSSLFGAYFVSLVVVLVNMGLYLVVFRKKFVAIAAITVVVVLSYVFGVTVAGSSGRSVSISLVQGNISQNIKWDPRYLPRNLDTYFRLSRGLKSDIVIWPESAFPYLFNSGYMDLVDFVRDKKFSLITGVVRYVNGKFYNSVVAITKHGFSFYDKQKLVPFGEYIPMKWLFSMILPSSLLKSEMSPGSGDVVFDVDGVKLGPMICYEENIPDISREYKDKGVGALLVLSNDAWFNHTPLFDFLARGAVFRAVENNVWVLRCANTGITEVISPDGSFYKRLPPYKKGVLTVVLNVSRRSSTVFDDFGFLFGPCLAVIVLLWIVIRAISYRRGG